MSQIRTYNSFESKFYFQTFSMEKGEKKKKKLFGTCSEFGVWERRGKKTTPTRNHDRPGLSLNEWCLRSCVLRM